MCSQVEGMRSRGWCRWAQGCSQLLPSWAQGWQRAEHEPLQSGTQIWAKSAGVNYLWFDMLWGCWGERNFDGGTLCGQCYPSCAHSSLEHCQRGCKECRGKENNEEFRKWAQQPLETSKKNPNKNPSKSTCLHYGNFPFPSKYKGTV